MARELFHDHDGFEQWLIDNKADQKTNDNRKKQPYDSVREDFLQHDVINLDLYRFLSGKYKDIIYFCGVIIIFYFTNLGI